MNTLYGFTRNYQNETGASMHLLLADAEGATALNHGFGILFPKSDFAADDFVGVCKGLVNPWIFRMAEGGFGVAALRRNFKRGGRTEPDAQANAILLFRSADLIHYEELGLLTVAADGAVIEDVRVLPEEGVYCIAYRCGDAWQAVSTTDFAAFTPAEAPTVPERVTIPFEDASPACVLELTDEEARALRIRFGETRLPAGAAVYPFPLMPERGDPMAIQYNGGYLFMATDDERGQRTLKIRWAEHLRDVPDQRDHVIFTANDEGDYSGCLWAPELHWVGGRLCIFFAAGMPHWYTVQSRVMWLEGSDPLSAACWSAPRRMERPDGTWLTHDGISITLDMTVVPTKCGSYVVWSQRPIYQDPLRCGTADLYIAKLNDAKPWRLASDPVLLTRPEYGWERIHSEVCEGPFLLRRGDALFLTYACALIDHTYAVGMLTAKDGDDLCDPERWQKENYPVLHRLSMPDQLGGGHNAFVKDEQGNDVMTLHALSKAGYIHDPNDGRRFPCFRQVVWDETGFPHFDAQ